MADTIKYEAASLGCYELDGDLFQSVVTTDGNNLLIKIGLAQAANIQRDTAAFTSKALISLLAKLA